MQRPGVRSELESEGHMLVSRARSWLKNLSSALEEIKTKKISDSFSDVQDLPQRLSTMRQLEDQVTYHFIRVAKKENRGSDKSKFSI